ncbi:hypothetical protein K438DRAFT_345499 [Mycena galopus ATCC 62051]|nr:hypothetical protein K438DRAFT_345499 [Mycena galopus ATCC 62051]
MSALADSEFSVESGGHQAIEDTIAGDCETELAEWPEMVHGRIIYPVLTLPNEITSEIFVHCLEPLFSHDGSTPNPLDVPMVLLHVCRKWRYIALSTPGLWTDIILDFDSLPQVLLDPGNLERFLEDYVAGAGARPLSLYLSGSDRREEESRRLVPVILERLSSRLQVLALEADSNCFPRRTTDFPLLQTLTLDLPSIRGEDWSHLQGNPIQTFSAAQQLRKLYMLGNATPCLFTIPCATLTEFTGDGLSFRDCVDLLRSAPSLEKCTLLHVRLDSNAGTINHGNLKSLQFALSRNAFFQFLTFPSLESLDVYMPDTDHGHLHQFISRSPSLLRLSLAEFPLKSLSAMAALTHLKFYEPSGEYLAAFFGFFHRAKNPEFLPLLQVLELNSCSPYVDTVLIDALSSRHAVAANGAPGLRSFRQIWPYDTPADALEDSYREGGFGFALEELVKRGIEIYIGHKRPKEPGAWLFNQPRVEI